MNHRELSLQFLKTTGLIPVRVRPKQKDPFDDWDPRHAATEDKAVLLAYLRDNPQLNIGALFSGKFVDLDVDNDNPALEYALDYFLPRTPYVWGRKSKPRSHRVFTLSEDFDRSAYGRLLRKIKGMGPGTIDENSYSLELRGGTPEAGLFSVLPGSIHPSGEAYEWAEGTDPTVGAPFITIHSLMRSLRLALAASIIAQYWISGIRNDMSLALAGLLWRIRNTTMASYGYQSDDEVPEEVFVMTEKDCTSLYKCIMELAGDEKDDERSRLLNLHNTWKKLDTNNGAKATGGKVLAELIGEINGDKTVTALYALLSDAEGMEELEALAERFVIWYGPGVLVDLDLVRKTKGKAWMTKTQATDSMGARKVRVGDKFVKIVNIMYNSNIVQRVFGMTFDPTEDEIIINTVEGPKVNQWRGFEVKPNPQTVLKEQVKPFLDYLHDIVCNGDKVAFEWVQAWIADLFQYPGNKPGTAVVLLGVQGAGKSFLGERIIGPIIGPHHYSQINSVTKLTDKFNANVDNKVFIQCDEAVHSYQKDVASRLKAMITDSTITVEPKGIDSYEKPNHMRLLFTSNEDTGAIFIDPSPHERRFTVLEVSPHKSNDIEYWEHMHEWVHFNLPNILKWLLQYKYDRKLVMRPFVTEAKRDIQRVGVDAEVSWILTRIAEGFLVAEEVHDHWFSCYDEATITPEDKLNDEIRRDTWPTQVQLTALEDDFKQFMRHKGRQVYSGSVMTSMRKVFPKGSLKSGKQFATTYYDRRNERRVHVRVRTVAVPKVQDIIAHLKERYGPVVDEMFHEMETNGELPKYLEKF